MLPKKKRKLFVLYSIPIKLKERFLRFNLCREKLHVVSYSIPLGCMVALLLVGIVIVNPSISDRSYALEVTEDNGSVVNNEEDGELVDESYGGNAGDFSNAVVADNGDEYGVMPLTVTAPSVTFSIAGAGANEVVETGVDEVAYRSHMVRVILNDVDEYFLLISGDTELTAASGGVKLTGTGTTGVTGSNIPAGQWGYGWDYTGNAVDADLTYRTVPNTQTKLTVPALSNNAANFNGRLAFAAKFPVNATLGNYTSNVRLTLIASPRSQTGSALWRNETGGETNLEAGTETMQGITSGFCKNNANVKEGWTVDLIDNRDSKTYTIYKAADGNCWMGQNLALTGPMTLASGDTDLPNNTTWDLPASVGTGGTNTNNVNTSNTWDTSNNNVIQIRTGSTSLSSNWKNGYGNYYSWPAATAGTGTTAVISSDAVASICPKGWKLPTHSDDYSFKNLTNIKSSWTTATYNGVASVPGYYFGSTKTTIYKGANFWPAAGQVYQFMSTLDNVNYYGLYWSRRARSDPGIAYYLYFDNNNVKSQNNGVRYGGYSVRCVAAY